MSTPDEWMQAIVRHAKAMRDSGVVRVELEGCKVEFAKPEQQVVEANRTPDDDEEYGDALEDPSTYAGGRVPTIRRRRGDLD